MFDCTIRNGIIVDGTGRPRYRADIGIANGRIAQIGRLSERGARDFDAEGLVVSPGFIDGHTHMDAQVFWDPLGTSSCWHGVTSVVMGNCGFTLAPSRPEHRNLIVSTLEKAEDITAATMAAGIQWTWESFREYLDSVERAPKAINYAANIGHSALRIWAMGERAFDQPATAQDLQAMARELEDALKAGAIGLSTSRARHQMTDGRPVASRHADWPEIEFLLGVVGAQGGGMLEFAEDFRSAARGDPTVEQFAKLAKTSGVPVTFGIISSVENPGGWQRRLDLLDEVAAAGGRMFGQCHVREISVLFSFKTRLPFDDLPGWREFRRQSLDEQKKALQDKAFRAGLVRAAQQGTYTKIVGAPAEAPDYGSLYPIRHPLPGAHPSLADIARERSLDPVDALIELALERDFDQFFFQPVSNERMQDVEAILRHPRVIMTFSDSGAHVGQIMDSSIHTTFLAYWVRERKAFALEEAVRMITSAPAQAWGMADRGIVAEGMVADLNIFDPDTIGPQMPSVAKDLPGGGTRLVQKSAGIRATFVAGVPVLVNGEHTGALPGRLIRGRQATA